MIKLKNKGALAIINRLNQSGYEAYLVGGSVRDLLLGKQVKDYDIATSATPGEVKALFKKVIPVGLAHGTLIVRINNQSYEVTTFRKKSANTSTQFIYGLSIEEDLSYRDFTMNAMALTSDGELIDLFNGEEDLKTKTIRAVENAERRFMEDPLRMLRAFRFVSQLGFTIEATTLNAIKSLKDRIKDVAKERIKEELTLLFQGKHVKTAIYCLIGTSLIYKLPLFTKQSNNVPYLLKENEQFVSFVHAIALVYYYHREQSLNQWVKAYKCSNKEKQQLIQLIDALDRYERNHLTNWLIYQLDESLVMIFIRLVNTIFKEKIIVEDFLHQKRKLPISSRSELVIDGNEIMKWFPNRKPGPWLSSLLQDIEYNVVMNQLNNDKESIKEWVQCHPLVIN